ncbi:MAG TPA: hypothetical protein VKU01_11265 [Bryobacteraceae bacterium]|nr:hypothetical protein [Bryobacteraceae bacterium]
MKSLRFYLILAACFSVAAEAQIQYDPFPSRIVGQPLLQQQLITSGAPNLVEGRELYSPQAVAVDNSATPPILYVADTNNNRILAWKNAFGFTQGDPADLVIGQRDMFQTFPKGPTTDLSTGLFQPTALVVDGAGNLYVADSGNNRIVRYPTPFQQTTSLLAIDLIIGQKDFASRSRNEGQSAPNERTLALTTGGGQGLISGLVFDSSGNLWISDPGNNRVLRYPASSLSTSFEPSADTVLGQPDFVSTSLPGTIDPRDKKLLIQPAGLAFDPSGRLFVAEGGNLLARVVVYAPPYTGTASRIMGVIPPTQTNPNPPPISMGTLGARNQNGAIPPNGVFFIGNNPYVIDTGNSRILEFDPYDQWPPETTSFSPAAISLFGQNSADMYKPNSGNSQPSASTLAMPSSAVFVGTDLIIADTGNNRVMAVPQTNGSFIAGARLLGQIDFEYNSANLIEGREFFLTNSGSAVIDTTSSPPHLYVADTYNNRILGFADARKVGPGVRADVVIGQPDFFTAEINFPANDTQKVTDSSLFGPQGMVIDAAGNLWVADSGNGRVLRFPRPFDHTDSPLESADMVLGQGSFFLKVTDPSSQTMRNPYGIALTSNGSIAVSDSALNRVLFFRKPDGSDFTPGQAAAFVIGQSDFAGATSRLFNGPRLISTDTSDFLYVADTFNNRILVFPNLMNMVSNDPSPVLTLTSGLGQGFNSPAGVVVSPATGDIWVADTNNSRVVRFPQFTILTFNGAARDQFASPYPLSVALDAFDRPVVAEGINRVSFYYPLFDLGHSGNAANFFSRYCPGMLAVLKPQYPLNFGDVSGKSDSMPWAAAVGDVQVLVNGTPAPLSSVSTSEIDYQVPSSTPVGSQLVEIQVVRVSTSEVLASGFVRIDPFSPSLFSMDGTGLGQLMATNMTDGSQNGPAHPVKVGTYVSLFGTGQGLVSGAPADGEPANGQIATNVKPRVFIGGLEVPSSDIQYSGLAPNTVGQWRIDAKVPMNVPPSTVTGPTQVVILYNDVNSSLDQYGNRILQTIRVSQ